MHEEETVLQEERNHIDPRRGASGPYWGLALSGGGIRSAAFGMGVLQSLDREGHLDRFDYLSTVSGGGYIGTSLTWFRHVQRAKLADESIIGSVDGAFLFGSHPEGKEQRFGDKARDFIRQHAKYLTPTRGLNLLSLVGVAFRGIFSSLTIYFGLMVAVTGLLFFAIPALFGIGPGTDPSGGLDGQTWMLWVCLGILWLLVTSAVLFSMYAGPDLLKFEKLRGKNRWFPTRYESLVNGQIFLGWAWKTLLIFALLGTLPYASRVFGWNWSAIGSFLGAAGGFLGLNAGGASGRGMKKKLGAAGLSAAALLLIYGMLLLSYHLNVALNSRFTEDSPLGFVAYLEMYVILAGFLVLIGLEANLNYIGHHRMYRDRLMELFLPNPTAVAGTRWERATLADETMLADVDTRPYHIINTNVVLTGSDTPRFRGRGGDSFILAPLYSGSGGTGWCKTDRLGHQESRGMTLATAMAISAAALNPSTGAAGEGPTRNLFVSALMSLLNLRLGYWLTSVGRSWPTTPNYIYPGLTSMLGAGHREDARLIELTDGGHFDNLGLYELVRRRLKLIVVSDAGCDPEYNFNDLANVIERVRVDFNALIRFDDDTHTPEGLLPRSLKKPGFARRFKLARCGHAVASIRYADGTMGTMLYIKTTLTDDLPMDVYGYRALNPEFPDQTTADQFFDERQFEAYRELGYQLAKRAIRDCNSLFASGG